MLTAVLGACSSDEGGATPEPPQHGETTVTFSKRYNEGLTFYSNILGQQVTYNILLPEEYLTDAERHFDVVYLFHGYGDKASSWGPGHFDISTVEGRARAAGKVRPLIYVMPDGGNSYFVNRYDGSYRYMDMLVDELVPAIDALLRTNATASSRAVAGYSMGGFGALAIASKHPETFSTCIGLSPSLNTDEQYKTLGSWDNQWGSVFGGYGTTGQPRLTSHYINLCPLHFFADNPAQYSSVGYFIDCGDDEERLYIGNGELHSLMRDNNVAHEYRVRNGAHTTAYWREGLTEGLAFFESRLSGAAYPLDEEPADATAAPAARTVGSASLYVGTGCKLNASTHIIYCELGTGAASLTPDDVAAALGSLLAGRNVALAVVKADANFTPEELFSAVEADLGLSNGDSHRQIMIYGTTSGRLAAYAFAGAEAGGFYAEDADYTIPAGAQFKARTYAVGISDMGTNYKAALAMYCALRDAGAPCQYRVRNGRDNLISASNGFLQLSEFMNLPIR